MWLTLLLGALIGSLATVFTFVLIAWKGMMFESPFVLSFEPGDEEQERQGYKDESL